MGLNQFRNVGGMVKPSLRNISGRGTSWYDFDFRKYVVNVSKEQRSTVLGEISRSRSLPLEILFPPGEYVAEGIDIAF